jgi:hypothetical protein
LPHTIAPIEPHQVDLSRQADYHLVALKLDHVLQYLKLESDLDPSEQFSRPHPPRRSMNRIAFDEDSEADRHGAAEAAVAGLESLMDDNSGEFSMACAILEPCSLMMCIHPIYSACVPAATQKAAPKRQRDEQERSSPSGKKKKELTTERREERNMREKERSLKISQQIHELRNLLSSGGVIVPKVRSCDVYVFNLVCAIDLF